MTGFGLGARGGALLPIAELGRDGAGEDPVVEGATGGGRRATGGGGGGADSTSLRLGQ